MASSGVGNMSMNGREYMQLDVVMLAILLYAILGKLADLVAQQLEKSYYNGIQHNVIYSEKQNCKSSPCKFPQGVLY